MREILFRGKRMDNGEWVEGFLTFDGVNEDYYIYDREVDPSTVGQYTGLKDKNGKRIFEGDIIKDDWGKTYEVFFTTKSCSFMAKLEHAPNEWEKGNYRLGDAWCSTICVIGNIHDNPELMDGKENNE